MQKDQLILKIYKYLDEGYLVSEIAETLDMPEERVWRIIEEVEKEDEPKGYEYYRRWPRDMNTSFNEEKERR